MCLWCSQGGITSAGTGARLLSLFDAWPAATGEAGARHSCCTNAVPGYYDRLREMDVVVEQAFYDTDVNREEMSV